MKQSKIVLFFAALVLFASCKKFDEFQENPNNPTTADPSLLLPIIQGMAFSNISADAALASRYLVYTQSASNEQYYGWQRNTMSYGAISQVVKMEQEAERVGKLNYRYIGKFFKSYFIVNMTQTFGDVPYSQMMQSIMNNNFSDSSATQPVYDKQQDIYRGVLDDLKIASDSLSAAEVAIGGDLVYDGDIEKMEEADQFIFFTGANESFKKRSGRNAEYQRTLQ